MRSSESLDSKQIRSIIFAGNHTEELEEIIMPAKKKVTEEVKAVEEKVEKKLRRLHHARTQAARRAGRGLL